MINVVIFIVIFHKFLSTFENSSLHKMGSLRWNYFFRLLIAYEVHLIFACTPIE